MSRFSKELIETTIRVWSPKAGYTISEDEAIEIIENLTGFFKTLNEIAIKIPEDVSKELIDNGNFVKVGEVDDFVPDAIGLYCIRLIANSILPKKYQIELEQRKNRLIYIGKAENKSLRKRFLKQELRAKGHGTFFRSVGAMLGFTPPYGSLRNKKNQDNYKFSKADEAKIIGWIDANLEASWIEFQGPFVIEKYLIEKHKPLLNIDSNPLASEILKKDRDLCKAIAKGEYGE